MNKTIQRSIFGALTVGLVVISAIEPNFLNDNNAFFAQFIGPFFLSFLGVIVSITLGSAANIHLEFNKLEMQAGRRFLEGSRRAVKYSAYALLWSLALALMLVCVKPLIPHLGIMEAIWNSACVLVVVFDIFVLVDLNGVVFKLDRNEIQTTGGDKT